MSKCHLLPREFNVLCPWSEPGFLRRESGNQKPEFLLEVSGENPAIKGPIYDMTFAVSIRQTTA